MSLDLSHLDECTDAAVRRFWATRAQASKRQQASGNADQGERAGVTAGKNMDGFSTLLSELAKANGLTDAEVFTGRSIVTLPGYFRPTKNWDMLIVFKGKLVAAIELKSQVGPSFGNNFNNRVEEAIGSACDFLTAFREGAFGDQPRPFLGWLILVEDDSKSRAPGKHLNTPHFDVFPEFRNASYLDRYEILCRKLVLENIYTQTALIASSRTDGQSGKHTSLSEATSLRSFAAAFAGHVAAAAVS
ncbi:MAG: PaeR7I family type II restriction endonuclease [Propionibacteriaceae bacterium]|nr:PaeR7I family type II restriction endonuclease [Propionibacteriaceae bacterium]